MRRAQLLKYWDRVQASLWFLPSVLVLGAGLLAWASLALDAGFMGRWLDERGLRYIAGVEGARSVLQTIATSMMTIAGVVFSLTLVALSLASAQFGPRLLRNFMRDTANQLVLGTFVATFLYCVVVMLAIRADDGAHAVPHFSVSVAVALALASVAVLIYFMHHVAVSVQADEMVTRVTAELFEGIDRLFPEKGVPCAEEDQHPAPADAMPQAHVLYASNDGYVQRIDVGALIEIARTHNVVIRAERRPGEYVVAGTALFSISPPGRMDGHCERDIHDAITLGNQRTHAQDIGFEIQELVEMALRALSPGVNEPYTALHCIDRLGSALSRLACRAIPASRRLDRDRCLRVIVHPVSFTETLDAAFGQIILFGCNNPVVVVRLLRVLSIIETFAYRQEDRLALVDLANRMMAAAEEVLPKAIPREWLNPAPSQTAATRQSAN